MCSVREIRKFGSYALLHDFFTNIFWVTDGIDQSFAFWGEDKEKLIDAPDAKFVKLSKQFIKQSQLT